MCLCVWLYIFKLSYKNTYTKNKITLLMSTVFGLPASYSYSIFATFLYCLLPTVSSIVVAAVADLNIFGLFPARFGLEFLTLTFLSIVSAISLVSVCVLLTQKLWPQVDIPGEMAKVKWIEGIMQTPPKVAWFLPLLSASFEEVFFRGVLLSGLLGHGMNTVLAITVVTLAFILNQIVLADTWTQRLVLGYSSLAISLVGSIVFLATGSIIPSMVMHASFAGFYTSNSENKHYYRSSQRLSI